MRRILAVIFLTVFCFAVSGCCTAKDACKGAAEGARKDWNNSCSGIKGADNWVKKNLW
ncbi:MAG: hypothetical protein ACM3OC_01210 [Deltaproteobacteria bacterium]